jgi:toxin ParE1/3/4
VRSGRRTVRFLQLAEDDLNEIVTFVAAGSPAAAETLISKIERALLHVAMHPYMGRVPDDEELVRVGYRYLVVDNYLLFYTVDSRRILVHRIIHGARDYLGLL